MASDPPAFFNLSDYVLSAGRKFGDKTALEVLGHGKARYSYSELIAAVEEMAAKIAGQTPAVGDTVLLRLNNTPRFPIAYLAAIAAGRVPVVTSAKLTQAEVDAITSDTGPKLTIADPGLPVPEDCATFDPNYNAMFEGYHQGDPNRPAYIVYTSGTSGAPRAVVHAHRAILARKMMIADWYDLLPTDRLMHAGAFNWTYTLGTGLLDPWTAGATALIPEDGTDAEALPALLAGHQATLFAASPGVFRRVLRANFPTEHNLRHALSAGEKLPELTRRIWKEKTGTDIHEAFGMSECSTFISASPRQPAPKGSMGFPQRGRNIEVRTGGQRSKHGTICIHKSDPGLMLGYLNQPEETQARFDGDWFVTGDVATQNADRSITYDGRADDMMNAGGHRVSPIEVENALTACAQIAEAACAEVRLRSDLSLIAAFYVAEDVINEGGLIAQLRDSLADYKLPRLFVRVPTLPRGNNNKLLRQKLKQDWEAEHGQT